MVSSAFYLHEIEAEMRERKLDWVFKGKLDDACDDFMTYKDALKIIPTQRQVALKCLEKGVRLFSYYYKYLLYV